MHRRALLLRHRGGDTRVAHRALQVGQAGRADRVHWPAAAARAASAPFGWGEPCALGPQDSGSIHIVVMGARGRPPAASRAAKRGTGAGNTPGARGFPTRRSRLADRAVPQRGLHAEAVPISPSLVMRWIGAPSAFMTHIWSRAWVWVPSGDHDGSWSPDFAVSCSSGLPSETDGPDPRAGPGQGDQVTVGGGGGALSRSWPPGVIGAGGVELSARPVASAAVDVDVVAQCTVYRPSVSSPGRRATHDRSPAARRRRWTPASAWSARARRRRRPARAAAWARRRPDGSCWSRRRVGWRTARGRRLRPRPRPAVLCGGGRAVQVDDRAPMGRDRREVVLLRAGDQLEDGARRPT